MALLVPGALLLSGCDLFGGGGSDTAGVSRATTTEAPTTTTKPADDGGRERAAADRDGAQRERDDQQDEPSQSTTAPPTSASPEPDPTTTSPPPPPQDDGGGDGNDQSTAGIALQVEVTDGRNRLRTATLSCVGDSHVGSGFLSGSGQAACEFVRQPSTSTRLTEGSQRDPDMMCTMIHGGPDVATVTGNIDGADVDTTFDRVNGCRIAEFDNFAPLIGPSGN